MSLRTTIQGDVVVVSIEGMLTGGNETHQLEQELQGLIAHGRKKILLDLERTSHLTSIALGMLVGPSRAA